MAASNSRLGTKAFNPQLICPSMTFCHIAVGCKNRDCKGLGPCQVPDTCEGLSRLISSKPHQVPVKWVLNSDWAPWKQSPTRSRRAPEKKLSRRRDAGQDEAGAVTAKSSLGLIHRDLWGMNSPTKLSTLREKGWDFGPQSQSVSNSPEGSGEMAEGISHWVCQDGTISPRL